LELMHFSQSTVGFLNKKTKIHEMTTSGRFQPIG